MKKLLLLFSLSLVFSCKTQWTDKNQSEFLSGCISGAIKDMKADKAKTYCHCMLQKIMQKYPDASDARYLQYDSAIVRMARDCRKQP